MYLGKATMYLFSTNTIDKNNNGNNNNKKKTNKKVLLNHVITELIYKYDFGTAPCGHECTCV